MVAERWRRGSCEDFGPELLQLGPESGQAPLEAETPSAAVGRDWALPARTKSSDVLSRWKPTLLWNKSRAPSTDCRGDLWTDPAADASWKGPNGPGCQPQV